MSYSNLLVNTGKSLTDFAIIILEEHNTQSTKLIIKLFYVTCFVTKVQMSFFSIEV